MPRSKNDSTMNSGTSTKRSRPKPDASRDERGVAGAGAPVPATRHGNEGLQPWQFFVLAALLCATGVTFLARGQGVTPVLLLSLMMATAALVGIAALRTVRPLLSEEEDRTAMVGSRSRAALEREKALTLRSIKELEFDRAMGKLSDGDWHEMAGRLRARAGRLMRQLDAGAGYREQIARDLAKRLGETAGSTGAMVLPSQTADVVDADLFCTQCGAKNEADARFCKRCGQKRGQKQ
jgi:hypothetical protein